jgi:hypothetical protein
VARRPRESMSRLDLLKPSLVEGGDITFYHSFVQLQCIVKQETIRHLPSLSPSPLPYAIATTRKNKFVSYISSHKAIKQTATSSPTNLLLAPVKARTV